MRLTVFIDKIGNIFNGDYQSANEHFEKYKDLSMRGIGHFASKDVYILNEKGEIVKSYGKALFNNGGVLENENIIRDFIIGKNINAENATKLGFTAFQDESSSVLIYKNEQGEYPLIKTTNGTATFYKNFHQNDYMTSIESAFKKVCVENAIKYNIK